MVKSDKLRVRRAMLAGASERFESFDLLEQLGRGRTPLEERQATADRIVELEAEIAELEAGEI